MSAYGEMTTDRPRKLEPGAMRLACGCTATATVFVQLCDLHRAEHNAVSARWRAERDQRRLAAALQAPCSADTVQAL